MLVGEPLHPYEMQRRIKLWGKNQVVNVAQRANLYKTIERLHQAGLIAVRQTERDRRFPERTVYELTEAGFRVAHEWLIEMLEAPRNEFPRFPAALSFLMMLSPNAAEGGLERRALALRETLAELEWVLSGADGPLPPRITLIETEYLRAMTKAELDWLCSVTDELRSGSLSWSHEELAEVARQFLG
jgi:DNA-binding PadR family transcriptional regulator